MDPLPHVPVTPQEILQYIEHIYICSHLEQRIGVERATQLHTLAVQAQLAVADLLEVLFADFPRVLHYRTGKSVRVESRAELTRKPPGFGLSPRGPWLDGLTDADVPWEPGQGPYAPDSLGHQLCINGVWEWFPVQWAPNLVYVRHPRIYAWWARAAYELVYLADIRNDAQLLKERTLGEVPRSVTRSPRTRHELTGRCFLDEEAQEAYSQLYEAVEISGRVPGVKTETTAPEASQVSEALTATSILHTTSRAYYIDKEAFGRDYLRVYKEQTAWQGSHASEATVARNMPTPITERTFRRYLRKWDLPYPPS